MNLKLYLPRCLSNSRVFNWKVAVSFSCLVTVYFYLYHYADAIFSHSIIINAMMGSTNKSRSEYITNRDQYLSSIRNVSTLRVFLNGSYTEKYSSGSSKHPLKSPESKPASQATTTDKRAKTLNVLWVTTPNSLVSEKPSSVNDSKPQLTSITSLEQLGRAIADKRATPLLTLFTTWIPSKSKYTVYNNTLKNWLMLKPFVAAPIVFTNDQHLAAQCRAAGWISLPVLKSAANGVPVLKSMYTGVMSKYESVFYAYSNADVLYDDGLLKTLFSVMKTQSLKKPLMMIGIRTNVANVNPAEASSWETVRATAKKRGKIFLRNAEDFFVTSKSYPWDKIADVVIGRRGYDNWLVLNARKLKHTVIEVTNTVLALHQTTKEGNFEGHRHRDGNYNIHLLSKLYGKIQYGAGSTICAPLKSSTSKNGTIVFSNRGKLLKLCYPL